jgi:hypothetical protein
MATQGDDQHFSGQITVAARIIDLLSSGLYESPASCLKELINNSFDADATEVHIFVKPDANRIIIQDDGRGMNRAEFERHFQRIAESHKRDESDTTQFGRPKIGKIGIGVVAANELCENLEIFSTKEGSTELLHVTIDFAEMRRPPEERKVDAGGFVKADYYGEIHSTDSASHFTQMFLTSIKGQAREILAGVQTAKAGASALTLYGLNPESAEKVLKNSNLYTWSDFDFYSKTMLEIALNVPVPYFDHWISASLKKEIREFEERTRLLNFAVRYDGVPLRKPIVFHGQPPAAFVQKFSFIGNSISADGYFYAQHGQIRPLELHGLLVRIRNAAVGEFDPSFWGFSASEYSLIQRWVSCEIWADDRLEDAMNIDRRTLRVTHPAYVELRNAIHDALRSVFSSARVKIYEPASVSRKTSQAHKVSRSIVQAMKEPDSGIDARTRRDLRKALDPTRSEKARRSIVKRYSVVEIFLIVFEVARSLLTPKQRREFLRRLTERLTRD